MKATQLIQVLQQLVKMHGDKPVVFRDSNYDCYYISEVQKSDKDNRDFLELLEEETFMLDGDLV